MVGARSATPPQCPVPEKHHRVTEKTGIEHSLRWTPPSSCGTAPGCESFEWGASHSLVCIPRTASTCHAFSPCPRCLHGDSPDRGYCLARRANGYDTACQCPTAGSPRFHRRIECSLAPVRFSSRISGPFGQTLRLFSRLMVIHAPFTRRAAGT